MEKVEMKERNGEGKTDDREIREEGVRLRRGDGWNGMNER